MQMGGSGVLYPPQPSPLPIPDLGDLNIPTPKDMGDWLDDIFGRKKEKVATGGPDPNDKKAQEKFKKVGKRLDPKGAKEEAGQGGWFNNSGPIQLNEAFLKAQQ